MDKDGMEHLAIRVSVVTLIVNLLLTTWKLLVGWIAHSGAMVSDGIHSASDVLSTLVVMAGVKLAGRESDREHPFGHERFECVAAIILAVMLAMTGAAVGWAGIRRIMNPTILPVPGKLALAAALSSIVVKEWMYWYTRRAAEQVDSSALMADAWHHRSDALSSVGSFLGIFGSQLGLPVMDPIASVLICGMILWAALGVFRDAVSKMVDRACAQEPEMCRVALAQKGVLRVDRLQTRLFGDRIYVELEISADAKASLIQAHQVSVLVHDAIEVQFPKVKHCMVHVNPFEEV